MNAKDLKFENNCFDLVIDKSTLDTVLCDERVDLNCCVVLREVQRVLKNKEL